jgi:ribokinase
MTIAVLGSANADLYVGLARLPTPGETLTGSGGEVLPGGKGANQAAAVGRLGHPVRFLGQVGEDGHGELLRRSLRATGVDDAYLVTIPGPTGQAVILHLADGDNAIVVIGGANRDWAPSWQPAPAALTGATALLLQREVPAAINQATALAARAAGLRVVLDAGGEDAPVPPALLAACDLLSPNETELARLTGLPTDSEAAVVTAARALQAGGAGDILVKLGARGALLLERSGSLHRQGAFPVPVVDTTGAGDCFTAAYAVAWVEGLAPAQRLRFAAAAAACCVTVRGAMPSLPSRDTVAALLVRHGSP